MKLVNLLPEWYLQQRRRRRQTRMHILAMLALAGILAGAHAIALHGVEELTLRSDTLTARLAGITDHSALVSTRQSQLARLQNIELAYQELGSPIPMSAVLQQIQNDMGPGMALSRVAVEVQPEAIKGSGFVGDSKAPPQWHDVAKLTVVGVSPDDGKIVELIGSLTGNPLFSNVSLNYERTETVREFAVRRFEIRMDMDVEQLGTENAPGAPRSVATGELQ